MSSVWPIGMAVDVLGMAHRYGRQYKHPCSHCQKVRNDLPPFELSGLVLDTMQDRCRIVQGHREGRRCHRIRAKTKTLNLPNRLTLSNQSNRATKDMH